MLIVVTVGKTNGQRALNSSCAESFWIINAGNLQSVRLFRPLMEEANMRGGVETPKFAIFLAMSCVCLYERVNTSFSMGERQRRGRKMKVGWEAAEKQMRKQGHCLVY